MPYTLLVDADTAHLIDFVKKTIEEYETPLKSKFYCEEKRDEGGAIVIVCHWKYNIDGLGEKDFSETVAISDFSTDMNKDQLIMTYKLLSY
jgi:hypothetical protein